MSQYLRLEFVHVVYDAEGRMEYLYRWFGPDSLEPTPTENLHDLFNLLQKRFGPFASRIYVQGETDDGEEGIPVGWVFRRDYRGDDELGRTHKEDVWVTLHTKPPDTVYTYRPIDRDVPDSMEALESKFCETSNLYPSD